MSGGSLVLLERHENRWTHRGIRAVADMTDTNQERDTKLLGLSKYKKT